MKKQGDVTSKSALFDLFGIHDPPLSTYALTTRRAEAPHRGRQRRRRVDGRRGPRAPRAANPKFLGEGEFS